MTGVNINTHDNSFNQENKEEPNSENALVPVNNLALTKTIQAKTKPEPATNNYFVMFGELNKMIIGQMAAVKHRYNTFSILSSTRLRSFKFDHIIVNDNLKAKKEDQSQSQSPDNMDTYTSVEVDRFIHQNKNLIYVNMTDDTMEPFPSILPEFPKKFYEKCKFMYDIFCVGAELNSVDNDTSQDGEPQKRFDIKVSFLLVRENERVDLIIEYFNDKLKHMSKDQMQENQNDIGQNASNSFNFYTPADKIDGQSSMHNQSN